MVAHSELTMLNYHTFDMCTDKLEVGRVWESAITCPETAG